jgi:quercetin dioxygenase-like cupin family protein
MRNFTAKYASPGKAQTYVESEATLGALSGRCKRATLGQMRALLTAVAILAWAGAAGAQGEAGPADVHWFHIPGLFPRGARMALVSGDPVQPGTLVALISMPEGYRMPPHAHTYDERVEVLQGTFLVGVGDKLDSKKTAALTTDDTATAPAGVNHFAVARGATIVRGVSQSPYVVNYVRITEEPWRPFPHGY